MGMALLAAMDEAMCVSVPHCICIFWCARVLALLRAGSRAGVCARGCPARCCAPRSNAYLACSVRGSKETEAFKAAGDKTDETKAKPNGYLFNPDEDDDGSANSSYESSMCLCL